MGINTEIVKDWINKTSMKYGGVCPVIDGHDLDWGQALCRFIYGDDWVNNPEFKQDDDLSDVPYWAIEATHKINDEWPDFVDMDRLREAGDEKG